MIEELGGGSETGSTGRVGGKCLIDPIRRKFTVKYVHASVIVFVVGDCTR